MRTLELTFKDVAGKNVILSVPNPKNDVTKDECDTAMASIISSNIFHSKNGDLTTAVSAKIRVLEVTALA